jgi:hypothetical protein
MEATGHGLLEVQWKVQLQAGGGGSQYRRYATRACVATVSEAGIRRIRQSTREPGQRESTPSRQLPILIVELSSEAMSWLTSEDSELEGQCQGLSGRCP